MMSKTTNKLSPEVRARAVRMVSDHQGEHPSRWAAVSSIAAKIGCTAQTLNEWVKKAEIDSGVRAGIPADVAERLKVLERENRELRQANEILRKASAYFCPGGARPPVQASVGAGHFRYWPEWTTDMARGRPRCMQDCGYLNRKAGLPRYLLLRFDRLRCLILTLEPTDRSAREGAAVVAAECLACRRDLTPCRRGGSATSSTCGTTRGTGRRSSRPD